MAEIETSTLAIDHEFESKLTMAEAQELKELLKKLTESYIAHKDTMPLNEWLHAEMSENLPKCSSEEITQMCDEILDGIKLQEEKKESLEKAIANGRSKESWFAGEINKATSHMSAQEASKYLQNLDQALVSANESLYRTIHTQAGAGPISQNPNLDGFIAEQYHAQTFNLNAEAKGSPYRAKVLEPDGKGYAKNSVDIVIVDENGNIVKSYQSKYYKDAEATAKAFEHGDYRGQRKLVPQEQLEDLEAMNKRVSDVLEAPDGTKSNPFTKEQAKSLQNEAQSGHWNDLNWNEYKVRDLAVGIGKQAGQAALMGAAIGVGFDVAAKVWNGDEINGEELVETAITTGADAGIKAAAAGALKVGSEKGIISVIPKGTPASTITSIVHVAVEDAKVLGQMATGDLTFIEGIEKLEQTTVASVAGIAVSTQGAALGATLGTVLGPVGTVIGGFIGGTVSYMAGSKLGQLVTKGAQAARRKVITAVSTAAETLKRAGQSIFNGLASLISS